MYIDSSSVVIGPNSQNSKYCIKNDENTVYQLTHYNFTTPMQLKYIFFYINAVFHLCPDVCQCTTLILSQE